MIGWRTLLLGGADAVVLAWLRPDFAGLLAHLRAPHRWLANAGADGAAGQLATAAFWLVAAWVALGLLAVAGRALPGGLGRTGDRLAQIVLPRLCYRALAGAIGIGALAAPVTAVAASGPAHPATVGRPAAVHLPAVHAVSVRAVPVHAVPVRAVPVRAVPVRAVPVRAVAVRAVAVHEISAPAWPTDPQLPTPGWPTTPAAGAPAKPSQPKRPSAPQPPRPSTPAPTVTTSTVEPSVMVRPGDSLWLIAAARLGPNATNAEIAAAWPQWYAANHAQIGPDPNQLRVGATLHQPGPAVRS